MHAARNLYEFSESSVLVVRECFSNCPSHVLKWFFVADWRLRIEHLFFFGFRAFGFARLAWSWELSDAFCAFMDFEKMIEHNDFLTLKGF